MKVYPTSLNSYSAATVANQNPQNNNPVAPVASKQNADSATFGNGKNCFSRKIVTEACNALGFNGNFLAMLDPTGLGTSFTKSQIMETCKNFPLKRSEYRALRDQLKGTSKRNSGLSVEEIIAACKKKGISGETLQKVLSAVNKASRLKKAAKRLQHVG